MLRVWGVNMKESVLNDDIKTIRKNNAVSLLKKLLTGSFVILTVGVVAYYMLLLLMSII